MASWDRLVEVAYELGPDPELVGVDSAELDGLVRSQAALVTRETARWIVLLAEFVVRGTWAHAGARTPGEWLSWAVGMAPTTARDHVRVGLALRTLPKVREAFLAGQISYSKVRAITRLGHEETEEVLLAWADAAPAAELERIVSWTRRACRVDGVEADPLAEVDPTDATVAAARVERMDWLDGGDGSQEARVRMDEADAARLRTNLRWLADQHEDTSLPIGARMVAALQAAVDAAMEAAPTDVSGDDRDRLVVAVDTVEETGDDSAESSGPLVGHDSAESPRLRLVPRRAARTPAMGVRTMERLACQAGIVPVRTDPRGRPLDVGRTQRTATAKQRRALGLRDPGCRFPGCTATRHLHVHHAREWADGGTTDLDNLIHLCSFHHRFIHRAGWQVRPAGAGAFTFLDADRQPFHATPSGVDSAESPVLPALRQAPENGRTLQPAHWVQHHVDYSLCVTVLRHELDRRQARAPATPLSAAA